MHDEDSGRNEALTELRRRLEAGLARIRLNKTELAGRARLGRTTVSEAFQADGPVPSRQTVAALAGALKLPVEDLLELQRVAAGGGKNKPLGLGRPIGQWDPHALEVHPAGIAQDGSDSPVQHMLPGYVVREHDRILAEAVQEVQQGDSRMLALVGESSTGKTRACWEAVQPLAGTEWRLWHPFDPTRAEAALEDLHRVGPRTVVWLNEAQHYLGHPTAGERIAAAVHHLLTSPQRGPVLVLCTLWPDYVKQYTALPAVGTQDPHSRVRELLAGRTVNVPNAFDARALTAATVLAEDGDRLLADALSRAHTDGRLTQDLAGGPALLNRYHAGSPAARALLEAAMDARRLGVGLHLPQAFLTDAATDYLNQIDYDQLADDWAEAAYAELAELVHGKQAPLRRTSPRSLRRPPTPPTAAAPPSPRSAGPVFRLADYLEQHGRTTRAQLCPPSSFWYAAHQHLTHPDDLDNLTYAARSRHRLQWAHHLQVRAADHGSTSALYDLAVRREEAGDREGADTLARQAIDYGDAQPMYRLARLREEAGEQESAMSLYRQAADNGDAEALYRLVELQEDAGDREGAETLARQAADHGKAALYRIAKRRERSGDREGAESLYRQAANIDASTGPARQEEDAGDRESIQVLGRHEADNHTTRALYRLALRRERAGDREGAETLAQQAAKHGDTNALDRLALRREKAGDREGAETLAQQAAKHGDTNALDRLVVRRERVGDQEGAETLARQAIDYGVAQPLYRLALLREEAGDRESAETLAQHAADHGSTSALHSLALLREQAGDREGAETLAQQAIHYGDAQPMYHLARLREEAGDRESAETLAQHAANNGRYDITEVLKRLWPYGLDPDGTPTPRWQ
ncbi:hypothetical protein ACWCQ1_41170 [Streptomyces sp. NPDC002144]